jgi:NAD(P)H-dependent flavin oxidoreductase YrpB (nitropropane dioxygenase family)
LLGIEFPLFAFSHCRDVVAAVSNAGGFGVLGASRHTPEELELELKWIDEHVHGRPYGVDILIPENMVGRDGSVDIETLRARVPERHKEFVQALLARYDVTLDLDDPRVAKREMPLLPAVSARLMDVAFSHPIKLIANALGVPPQSMIDRARAQGVPVAALVTRSGKYRRVSTSSSPKAPKPAATPAKSRRSCWSPKSFAPSSRSGPYQCSPRAA